MLQHPDFDPKEIDPDLHQRMAKAVDDGRIKRFNLREGPAGGDQDLNLWIREVEDLVREIMEDPIFKGNQNFHFEMDIDELGRRLFGSKCGSVFSDWPIEVHTVACTVYTGLYLVHTNTYWFFIMV